MIEKSTQKRVLILTTAYLPQVGGSELAIKNITDRLPGIWFDLITSRPFKNLPEHEKIANVNVYRVGKLFSRLSFLLPKNFLPVAIFFKACRLIRKHGTYDVIHAYQASQAAGGGWLLKWIYPRIPLVITVQEGKVLSRQSWLIKFFRHLVFKKADRVTAISNYLAEYVKTQNYKIPISIIPNGVNLEQFPVSSFQFTVKDKKENTIITVSRLVEKNGIKDLIEAMAIVVKEIPYAKLKIIGSGPLEKDLKFQVKSLNLENNVEFFGEISNKSLPEYLYSADVFVRPSLSEGLGTAFLEAMAAGLPVIGTPVGGIPDFLKNGETGLFCKVNDPEDLADKIVKILNDGPLRERITNNAHELVEEKYDWNKIAAEFGKIYNNGTI